MSLNTSHANGGVLIFNGERILIFYGGIEMSFESDAHVQQFKGKKKGRVFLTTHRVIFLNKDPKDLLQSFSMAFFSMKGVELEQPVFGANYIKGTVNSEPSGNWQGSGTFKMWFNNGGAIEFGKAMLRAGQIASKYTPAHAPAFTPPSAPYYQAPPPAYAPPPGDMYAFVPYQTFPEPPPYNMVYMMPVPPPYPGMDPNLPAYTGATAQQPPYPPQNGATTSADAKATEAVANGAYYNPADPRNVYMPQPPSYAPPPYPGAESDKKGQ